MKNTKYFALTENGIVSGDAADVRRNVSGMDVRVLHKMQGGLPVLVNVWDFMHKTEKKNRDTCKRISDDLDAYVEGRVCRCPDCGEVNDVSNWDPCSLYDYFDDFLDIDFISNCWKEYKACRVLVAFGGPNIYIDTLSGAVELYWWSDRASFPLSRDTMDAVDEWAEDYYNCIG